MLLFSNFLSFDFTYIPWLWDEGQKVVTMAGKADAQGSIRAPRLGGDISQVATVCGAHCGCPVPLLTQGLAQALYPLLRLGCCDSAGAQDFCPHPCRVTGMD